MNKNQKWVVFDVGGVLLDWKKGRKAVADYLEIEEKYVSEGLSEYYIALELGQLQGEEAWSKVLTKLMLSHSPKDVLKQWVEGQSWVDSAWQLAKDLYKDGYKLALFTNNWIGVMDEFKKTIPEFSIFSVLIDSSVEGLRKPNEEIYLVVEKKLNSAGDDIYFIDDNELNIETAKRLNWNTYLFDLEDGGLRSSHEIRKELSGHDN